MQPTHILYGTEYEKMMDTARRYTGRFEKLAFGRPLLSDHGSLLTLAEALIRRHGGNPQCAAVFLGHGSAHFAGMAYPALQTALRADRVRKWLCRDGQGLGRGYEEVLRQLEAGGYREVKLVPMLLASGGATFREMAGGRPRQLAGPG